jgi:hypothetical protein
MIEDTTMKNSEKTLILAVSLLFMLMACSKPEQSDQTTSTPIPEPAEHNTNPQDALVKVTAITVNGEGNKVMNTSGGGNCSPLSANVIAEVAIVGGAAGNTIAITASCALGAGATATATAIDSGGPAVRAIALGNPGRGKASCTHVNTSVGMPDSAWTAVCTF